MAIFLTFSSGLVVTIHHCCSVHHHSYHDHHHCHEDVMIFKITDHYNIADSFHFHSFQTPFMWFFENDLDLALDNSCRIIIKENRKIPPYSVLEGREFIEFCPQRIFYC